jgi:carotenoid cleavage dioxygenase
VFHTLNAHEEAGGQRLVLHLMRYPSLGDGVQVTGRATLWRWTVDLTTGTVREEQLDDRQAEFPRIDDRLAGLPARLGDFPLRFWIPTDRRHVHLDRTVLHVGWR